MFYLHLSIAINAVTVALCIYSVQLNIRTIALSKQVTAMIRDRAIGK